MMVMRSAQMNGYGSSEVIQINQNAAAPNNPSAGKVLVKVKAAGINPFDWKIREGYMQQMIPLKFPTTPGGDFSGIIEKVGDQASGMRQGDEVYGQASVLS